TTRSFHSTRWRTPGSARKPHRGANWCSHRAVYGSISHSQSFPAVDRLRRPPQMPEAVIVDAVRSPIGRAFKGSLTSIRPDELGAYVVDQLLERHPEVDPGSIEDLICGCGLPQGEQSYNIGRIIVLLSRLPDTVTGT